MAKGRSNYFEMNIQKKGENFIEEKTTEELQRDAKKRIFQDMAFGNIEYEKFGMYFTNPRFLEQLIIVSADEAENHRVKYSALREYDTRYPGDSRVVALCATEGRLTYAYETINAYLRMVRDTNYNISSLTLLTPQIFQYRQDIANN